jgi:hypothetical protein
MARGIAMAVLVGIATVGEPTVAAQGDARGIPAEVVTTLAPMMSAAGGGAGAELRAGPPPATFRRRCFRAVRRSTLRYWRRRGT